MKKMNQENSLGIVKTKNIYIELRDPVSIEVAKKLIKELEKEVNKDEG